MKNPLLVIAAMSALIGCSGSLEQDSEGDDLPGLRAVGIALEASGNPGHTDTSADSVRPVVEDELLDPDFGANVIREEWRGRIPDEVPWMETCLTESNEFPIAENTRREPPSDPMARYNRPLQETFGRTLDEEVLRAMPPAERRRYEERWQNGGVEPGLSPGMQAVAVAPHTEAQIRNLTDAERRENEARWLERRRRFLEEHGEEAPAWTDADFEGR